MAVSEFEGVLTKLAPLLIPPSFLVREDKFPDVVKVFEDISENPPHPRSQLGKKYLYLSRVTGLIWLLWIWNFILFLSLVLTAIIAWGADADLTHMLIAGVVRAKLVFAATGAVLFIGAIMAYALLKVSIELRDVCYALYRQEKDTTPTAGSPPQRIAGVVVP